MSDSTDDKPAGPQRLAQSQDTPTSQPANALREHRDTLQVPTRAELLDKARAFLNSPQVQHEDIVAKRRFLTEKGLIPEEVDVLLREVPPAVPLVPPRTYPQPPPSKLPDLLVGVLKIVSWIAGSSAALLLIYFRFLYPRISQTYQARLSLKTHQRGLLDRLTRSLEDLKSAQRDTFAILPKPELFKDPKYEKCHTLDDLILRSEGRHDVPNITVLRCALEELKARGSSTSTEEIFATLGPKLPQLQATEAQQYEAELWETLSTHYCFQKDEVDGTTTWTFGPPTPSPPPPLLSSLTELHDVLPKSRPQPGRFQHTFQALSEFTGYITSQTYTTTFRAPGMGLSTPLGPGEEELRREIRALKGLVLNRRSFMPNVPRPASASALPSAHSAVDAP
ncbi:hypothetical protein CERSUDRAFT_111523 [Gelatoporia subvermispora B]|uniref:Peroxisome membrane anchor protein Pex14p N-terminal domain-containing protein n=1 Tax=Ceriporiopsis subvermispora (strain B) TaxID=914234 RepID=M2QV41_CERS8|nr:hypothetical protein CERSUDRAFT_111523 [Gelatoporia subvermispora B]